MYFSILYRLLTFEYSRYNSTAPCFLGIIHARCGEWRLCDCT